MLIIFIYFSIISLSLIFIQSKYFILVDAIFQIKNLKILSLGYPDTLKINSVLNLLNINNKIGIEVIKCIIR